MAVNKTDYLSLAIVSIIYVMAIFRYQTVPKYMLFATVAFALTYLLWGIFHHLHSHNLRGRIVLEYLLVSLLGVAVVSTLLL